MISTYYAVYDTSEDSDYYSFDTCAQAIAEANDWTNEDWYRNLVDTASYGAISVYEVAYEVAPWDTDEDWSLWADSTAERIVTIHEFTNEASE